MNEHEQKEARVDLARLEAMIEDQEDIVLHARTDGDTTRLAHARTSLWRLLTKRQGVVDALVTYEQERDRQAHQTA